jgi:hypothetical protein
MLAHVKQSTSPNEATNSVSAPMLIHQQQVWTPFTTLRYTVIAAELNQGLLSHFSDRDEDPR